MRPRTPPPLDGQKKYKKTQRIRTSQYLVRFAGLVGGVGQYIGARHSVAQPHPPTHTNHSSTSFIACQRTCIITHYSPCCGSGSGRIGIILPDRDRDRDRHPVHVDLDPDLYSFQPNAKKNYFFSKCSNIMSKILKIMALMTMAKKLK